MTNVVDEFYQNYIEFLRQIQNGQNPSLVVWAHENFRRMLIVAMANYLENEMRAIMKDYWQRKSANDLIHSFLLNSMERQYHTYFDWEGKNAHRFFALFGDNFKQEAIRDVEGNDALKEGIREFLEIGRRRNLLVHERLHQVDIGNKTAEEFYGSFQKALVFIDYIKTKLA
jgi:hypothetical protein